MHYTVQYSVAVYELCACDMHCNCACCLTGTVVLMWQLSVIDHVMVLDGALCYWHCDFLLTFSVTGTAILLLIPIVTGSSFLLLILSVTGIVISLLMLISVTSNIILLLIIVTGIIILL